MTDVKEYVEKAFMDIPYNQRKEEVIRDIIQSLEDSTQILIEKGKTQEDAINKAIVEFGDLNEIKKELYNEEGSQYIQSSKNILWFSIVGSCLIIGLLLFINLYYTPKVIWITYPIFCIVWWPISIFFFGKWRRVGA